MSPVFPFGMSSAHRLFVLYRHEDVGRADGDELAEVLAVREKMVNQRQAQGAASLNCLLRTCASFLFACQLCIDSARVKAGEYCSHDWVSKKKVRCVLRVAVGPTCRLFHRKEQFPRRKW